MTDFNRDAHDLADAVVEAAREHPVSVALAGFGLGWLVFSAVRSRRGGDLAQSEYPEYVDPAADGPVFDPYDSAGREGSGTRWAREAVQRAGSTAAHLGEQARTGAVTARHEAERLASAAAGRARRTFAETVEERPLLLAALGLAIGGLVGAALPRTRQEREWLDEAAEEARAGAEAFAREQVRRGEAVAERAAEAARDEARRQGLILDETSGP
ncbi:MAG: hypothetical protein ACK4QW_02340 [Alphaproteobacteria bacterium]